MYPENPEGTQVIVGSMNMGYISDTGRNQTHNLFRPKREPIPLGYSDGLDDLVTILYELFLGNGCLKRVGSLSALYVAPDVFIWRRNGR